MRPVAIAVAGVICFSPPVPTAESKAGAPSPVRVEVRTNLGSFLVELDPAAAPVTVSRFLNRAGLAEVSAGAGRVFSYAGSYVCELRAHGFIAFGCAPYELTAGRPKAPGIESPTPDEIDGAALGLEEHVIVDPAERDWLWQAEIFPRYVALRERGRPVPPGLADLVASAEKEGTAAMTRLSGMTRLGYLEAIGYRYEAGRSAAPPVRGAVLTANLFPGEADERFLVALAPLPEREGRGTVYGRVVGGWETLDAIEHATVDRLHRPLSPIRILGITWADPPPGPAKDVS